jgi:ATP-dependent DNA helicase DinG
VAAALGGNFEARPEQIAMAAEVARTLEQRSHLLVEAGTGVGKSFAYLVPAILRCLQNKETVVVVTNTIALQEQLVNKDIPFLRQVLDPDPAPGSDNDSKSARVRLKPVLVKGRGNYVSIRRLSLASKRQDRLFNDAAARRSLHVIQEWAMDTDDGTLSSLPPLERPGIWDRVQSDSGNCMGRKCKTYEECFYQSARREMDGANLLVCNHALFFSDLALRAQEVGFLPKYDHVILDEAHQVEDAAAEHFGVSLAEGRVQHLLTTLCHPRTGKGYLPQLQMLLATSESVERAMRLVIEAQTTARDFFESLLVAADRERTDASGEEIPSFPGTLRGKTARIRRPGIVENPLTPAMDGLALRLKTLRDECKNEEDRFELNAYSIRAAEVALAARTLVDQALKGCAYWVEVTGGDDSPTENARFQRVTFACSPIDVAPLLKERLFNQPHSVILTSATLATRRVREDETGESGETAFGHAIARLGCEGAKTLQLGSPFDHAAQTTLYIDRCVPHQRHPRYTQGLARRILYHVLETDGGAFVLFTSFASLRAVARVLAPELASRGMPLLVHGAGVSRTQLLDQFRTDRRSVLLGAASFWQGVDVRGEGLRNVIITKLPFEPPDRPLTEARLERIEEEGGNPFMEDSVPRAVIRFKQGFGRLIRSKTDTGRVVVLDSRIATARYGKRFLDALPLGVPVVTQEPETEDTL